MKRLALLLVVFLFTCGCIKKPLIKLDSVLSPDTNIKVEPKIDGNLLIEGDVGSPEVVISSPKVIGVEKPTITIKELLPKKTIKKVTIIEKETKADGTVIEKKTVEETKTKSSLLLVVIMLLIVGVIVIILNKKFKVN